MSSVTIEHRVIAPAREQLLFTAEQFGLVLPDENLDDLAAHFASYPFLNKYHEIYPATGHLTGVRSGLQVQTHLFQDETNDVQMQFRPPGLRNSRENIMLQGLYSVWNYLLLCEAGAIATPEHIYGTTNYRMARIGHKLGFKAVFPKPDTLFMSDVVLRVRYEQMRERAFSKKMQNVANRLSRLVVAES